MSLQKVIITFFSSIFFYCRIFSQDAIPPIGYWRDYLPYHSAIDVAAGNNQIFCATPYSIFSVDLSDNSITRMSRVNGLHETGISAIEYDAVNNKLFIGYKTSNIDIIYRNYVFNIPDIKIDNIIGDKTIYDVFSSGKYFYLSTGLGVVVIDADKYEVKDSWFIGNNGGQAKVNGFTADNSFYYAATNEGLKRTATNTVDPANYLNWENLSGANGLSNGVCNDVVTVSGKIFVLKNDSVFVQNGNNWSLFFTETNWKINNINPASGKVIVCQTNNANAKVTSLNTDGTIARIIQQAGSIVQPMKIFLENNNYWIADSIGSLNKFTSTSFQNYNLNSPQSIATGEIVFANNTFYATAGSVNANWQKQNNKNGLYKFSEGQWTNYNNKQFAQLDSFPDIISVSIDPADGSVWAGSYGGGLLHIKTGNNFEILKQNSSIGQTTFDPGSYRVSGLAFDRDKNLWIANYGAAQNIAVRKNDNTWKTFTTPFTLNENAVAQIVVDDEDQKWIVSPKNGLIVFNDNKTIDNATDDKWKLYRNGQGIGNLPTNNVLSITKDKNGFIWVGTDDGIGVIQCPQEVFSSASGGCDAVLPVVTQGGFNQYLFKAEEVRSIAVDGADRKWVATKNGAFLISAEGDKVIYRFTETNSPLLSNDVKRIAIDGKTGEIFFATANGICSFRSTATEGGQTNSNVLVFPNPVPPGYSGTIAIRGLVNNAIVKITELDGRLVYQTRALGGQAVWDGKDYKGRRISSGIYLVLVSDEGRKENLATKIVFISK